MKKTINYFFHTLQSIFLTGLFALLPIVLTIALVKFAVGLLLKWLEPLYALEPSLLKCVPYSEIIWILLVIGLTGLLIKYFVFDIVLHTIEQSLFNKIPLLRHIYFGFKQLVAAFNFGQHKITFKHVVLIEFPQPGIYSIGFLTNYVPNAITPHAEQKFVSILIPITPNPAHGYYIIVPENSYHIMNISYQEAMATIISGGIIQPKR